MKRTVLFRGLIAVAALGAACSNGRSGAQNPNPSAGSSVADPRFDALPGATAHFGQRGDTAYEIEVPNRWNGDLVMYLHGGQEFTTTVRVEQPPIREYLITRGYAWAASSFDRNELITGIAADETADLLAFVSSSIGEPRRTYVLGASMGGGGAIISAERYPDSYAGALALCPIAGVATTREMESRYFIAAAYAAGVTQREYDESDIYELDKRRIRPALADASVAARFRSIWTALTGGERPFAAEGLYLKINALENLSEISIDEGLLDNRSTVYELKGAAGISDADFNQNVIRITPGDRGAPISEEITGGDRDTGSYAEHDGRWSRAAEHRATYCQQSCFCGTLPALSPAGGSIALPLRVHPVGGD